MIYVSIQNTDGVSVNMRQFLSRNIKPASKLLVVVFAFFSITEVFLEAQQEDGKSPESNLVFSLSHFFDDQGPDSLFMAESSPVCEEVKRVSFKSCSFTQDDTLTSDYFLKPQFGFFQNKSLF